MNDKKIIKKHDFSPETSCKEELSELETMLQEARQDERKKSQTRNVGLQKQIEQLQMAISRMELDYQEQRVRAEELKARWEKLEKVIFDVHNCEACGNRCDSHIDAWCDIIEDFMHELEKEGKK